VIYGSLDLYDYDDGQLHSNTVHDKGKRKWGYSQYGFRHTILFITTFESTLTLRLLLMEWY